MNELLGIRLLNHLFLSILSSFSRDG